MLIFAITLLAYVGALVLYRPAPECLKGTPLTLLENARQVKASVFTGVVLLFMHLLFTRLTFGDVDKHLHLLFGLNNLKAAAVLWPFQIFTNLWVHYNLIHLLSNVAGIGLASAYERRVGARRYLAVLMVGAIASSLSVFLYATPIIACGISGGVFALAAAYFTDHRQLSVKEWVYAIVSFLILAVLFSLNDGRTMPEHEALGFQVDHLGHLLGACAGILYCRIRPLKG